MGAEKKRIYWLDAARTVAIISISLNHAVNRSYDNYTNQLAEYLTIPFASTVFKAVISVFSRLGVPLFLMISGALLLKKNIQNEDGIRRFYRHNYLDLFITSEIWYFIMYWRVALGQVIKANGNFLSQIPFLLWGLLKTMLFIDQVTFDSMWYIPMILAVYLLIPIFALVLKKVSLKVFVIPCAIVFVSTMVIPNINAFLSVAGSEMQIDYALRSSNIFSGYFLYVFAGYWISAGGLEKIKKTLAASIGIIAFIICCIAQIYIYSRPENYLISYDFPFVLLSSVFLFECVRRAGEPCDIIRKVVEYVSKISFAIYFIHILIMTIINKLPVTAGWPRPLLLIYLEVVSFGASIGFIRLFSHVQFCRRRLFLIKD